ncbi:MAG: hypothetical protein ABIN18_30485 [Pseudomonadota bacterium]
MVLRGMEVYRPIPEVLEELRVLEKECGGPDAKIERTTGHVSTLRFDSENELNDYLESLGDEITGFYECQSESRPYNF